MPRVSIQQNVDRLIKGNQIVTNMKTVICHFYNEEKLLPWWLEHHKRVFDHGIMIDYHSTDRSMEIIREICPDWELRYTRNKFFNSVKVDEEVMNIEKMLGGWRMTLNVTEFLYGNTDHLRDLTDPTQYFIGNYVFVDMENPERGQTILDRAHPLHKQRYWGYDDFANTGANRHGPIMSRMSRSIHNYPVTYTGGRHWSGNASWNNTFNDLVIFYYGWADFSDEGIKRKDQIKSKIGDSENATVHHHSFDDFRSWGRARQADSRDLRPEIANILEHNRRITGAEW
jgi:hypothetical protein